jgi:hypothetical protein
MNNYKYTKNKASDRKGPGSGKNGQSSPPGGSERSTKVARTGDTNEANNMVPPQPLRMNDGSSDHLETNSMNEKDDVIDDPEKLAMKLPGKINEHSKTMEKPKAKERLSHHPLPEDHSVMENHGDQLAVVVLPLQRLAWPVTAASSMDLDLANQQQQPQPVDGPSSYNSSSATSNNSSMPPSHPPALLMPESSSTLASPQSKTDNGQLSTISQSRQKEAESKKST